jgi:hypothetical protein
MMTTALAFAITAYFLRVLYQPAPGRSRQGGFIGAIAAGGAKAAAAAAKAAAAAAKAGAAGVAKGATAVAKGATTAGKAVAGGAKAAGGAVKGVAGSAATGVTGGTTGVLGGLLGKSEKQPAPPAVPSTGAVTPSVIEGTGGGMFDSAKATSGEADVALAQVIQERLGAVQQAPVGQGTVRAPQARVTQPVPAASGADRKMSRREMIENQVLSSVASQAFAAPTQRNEPPRIASFAESLPGLAEGGVAPAGQPFIAGEAGGSPEVIEPQPDGSNVVTPIQPDVAQSLMTQPGAAPPAGAGAPEAAAAAATPAAAQPAQGAQPGTPEAAIAAGGQSFLGKAGDLATDYFIASLLGNPALTINLQQQRTERRQWLAGKGIEDPSIIASSPDVAQAIEELFGEGYAQKMFDLAKPGEGIRRQAIKLGMSIVPPGTMMADGTMAPDVVEQLNAEAYRLKMDFRIGADGLQLSKEAPNPEQVADALGFSSWAALTSNIQQANPEVPPWRADKMAARALVGPLGNLGVALPPELRDMAFADTDAQIAAASAQLTRRAAKSVDLAFGGVIAAADAAGAVWGKAQGDIRIGAETIRITQPDGTMIDIPVAQGGEYFKRTSTLAMAISGVPGAIDLGPSPSKQTMGQIALQGMDVIIDFSGRKIALPIGHKFGGNTISAGEVVAGPQAVAALDEALLVIDDVQRVPNILKAFPSEAKWGRETARGVAWIKSWLRGFTDSPELLLARGQLRQMGFRMARLLGSNSQLSDPERAAAAATYTPLMEGTATYEQVKHAFKRLKEIALRGRENVQRPGAAARRIIAADVAKGKPPGARPPASAGPNVSDPIHQQPQDLTTETEGTSPTGVLIQMPDGTTMALDEM